MRLGLNIGYSGSTVVDPTPLVREARERGISAIDGFDLLVAQAVLQFERLTGSRAREPVLRSAGAAWLARVAREARPA